MSIKNILFGCKLVVVKRLISFLVMQTISITICYSQQTNGILEDKSNIFKVDYRLNGESAPYNKFVAVLAEDNIAYKQWKTGRALKAGGIIIILPSAVFIGLGIGNINSDDDIARGLAPVMLLGGLGGSIIGTALITIGNNKSLNAINLFNSKRRVYLDMLNNRNNLGIVIKLNK